MASDRLLPEACEICGLLPPTLGVGFPRDPRANVLLPDHLRGAVLWTCGWRTCRASARARALAAARRNTRGAVTLCTVIRPQEPGPWRCRTT
jgi:hypothetical protein